MKETATITPGAWSIGRRIPKRDRYDVRVIDRWESVEGNPPRPNGRGVTFVVEGHTIRMDAEIFRGLQIGGRA